MNFKKGDRVKFLNDVGQGVIVRFQDKNIVVVLNDDGFEVPIIMSEILKIEGNYSFSDENENDKIVLSGKEDSKPLPIIEVEDDLEEDGINTDKNASIFFALVPINQNDCTNSDLAVYLINDSNFRIMYSIAKSENNFQTLFAYGILEDNTKVILQKIKRDELNSFETMHFQIIFFRKGNYTNITPIDKKWSLKPSRFYKQNTFTENDFFNENAFIYELTAEEKNLADYILDSDIEKAKKEKDPKKHVQSNVNTNQIEEVDLHIQELVDDYSTLSNAEILDIQMARFITTLEGGILSGTKKMVFIHGVGNGKLKQEIRKTIERKYPKLRTQDASFKEYGYGATMVILS